MKTAKKDAVRRAIMDGLTNYEIRRDIDGRLSDRYIDQMRSEDALIEGAMQAIFPEMAQEGEAVEMEESGEDAAPEAEAPEDEPEREAELPGPEAVDEIPEGEEDSRKIGGGICGNADRPERRYAVHDQPARTENRTEERLSLRPGRGAGTVCRGDQPAQGDARGALCAGVTKERERC